MSQGKTKGTFQPDSDVHISFEDQQKINKFARNNARLDDLKDELKMKQNDIKNLEEACDEISLFDESDTVPYLVGEVFIYQNVEKTLKCLAEAKAKKEIDIKDLEKEADDLKSLMSDLKGHLYGKFGSHINLENDEDTV